MYRHFDLRNKLLAAFLIMGIFVLGTAGIAYSTTAKLSNYVNILISDSLPSIDGLWKIDDGINQIYAAETMLLDHELNLQKRQDLFVKLKVNWSQINEGLKQVEATNFSDSDIEEKRLYKVFLGYWNVWKVKHQEFMQLESEYNKIGIQDPRELQNILIAEGKKDSSEMVKVQSALLIRKQIQENIIAEEVLYKKLTKAIFDVLCKNQQDNLQIKSRAVEQVFLTTIIVRIAIFIGPALAVSLGVFFSIKIANPVDKKIRSMVRELENARDTLEEKVAERTKELKFTLANLQTTQQQLIQSEKMSSLGTMVAGVAHEINNPINFIHANLTHARQYLENLLELLKLYKKNYPHPELEIENLADEIDIDFLEQDLPYLFTSMQTGSKRIRDIIISLRNFSRLDESEQKEANLNEGIESTLLILSHQLNEIKVIRESADLPLIKCYPGLLNQVVANLISNAIDAKATQIIITTNVTYKEIEIKIQDNGCGIPLELQNKIFDPFFSTKSVGQGIGLGLSVCYQIMQQHQGKIEVSSQLEKGSKFVLTLPIEISSIPHS
jgi:signal transduction histidine kinase